MSSKAKDRVNRVGVDCMSAVLGGRVGGMWIVVLAAILPAQEERLKRLVNKGPVFLVCEKCGKEDAGREDGVGDQEVDSDDFG